MTPDNEIGAAGVEPIEPLLRRVDVLSSKELDALPYGMIQLDAKGTVLQYNEAEASLSRLDRKRVVGKNFFEQVAPCTKVREFHGRFLEGVAKKKLFESFGFVFKFEHGWRNVAITLMYSDRSQSIWVLVSQNEPGKQIARTM